MTVITYVGRKSGRTFSAPVSYKTKRRPCDDRRGHAGQEELRGAISTRNKVRSFSNWTVSIAPARHSHTEKARVSTSPSNSLPSTERIEQPPVQSHSAHTHRLTRSG